MSSTYNRPQGQTEAALVAHLRERCQQVPEADFHDTERHVLVRVFPDFDRPDTHVAISAWDLVSDTNHVTVLPRDLVR